jgi:Fe-S-cluster-containing hydrogenase component 2
MKTRHTYRIDEAACINCGSCRRFCPVDAIPYRGLRHQVEMARCIGCTICFALCPVDAVIVSTGDTRQAVALEPATMERVRASAWVKGPFYQQKRRLSASDASTEH